MKHRGTKVTSQALRACLRLQRSHVEWLPGIRTGIVVSLVLLIALSAQQLQAGTSIALGAFFIALFDSIEAPRERLRSMAWGAAWVSFAVLLGGLVSESGALHVGVAVVMAAACGFAGALGSRGALIGVLMLVLFAIYSGTLIGVDAAINDAALFALGGLLTIAVNLAMTPLHRLLAPRVAVARTFREIQQATARRGVELAAPTVAAEIMSARTIAAHQGCAGATEAWITGFLADAERMRIGLVALLSERHRAPEFVDELTAAVGHAAGAVAGEIDDLWGRRSARRQRLLEACLARAESIGAQAPGPRVATLTHELIAPLRNAVDRLRQPWPLGERVSTRRRPASAAPPLERLRAHAHLTDSIAEHAIRLTIAFGGATLVAVLLDVPHSYWVPMTVAWVAKPDLSGTVSRITMRVAGTIVGLVLVSGVLLALRPLADEPVVLIVLVGGAACITLAFVWANYPLAVVGITTLILLLEHLDGDNSPQSIIARLAATIGAGLWVLLVASVRPRRTGAAAVESLAATATALRDYASALRLGDGLDAARAAVLARRTTTVTAIAAAALEPPGLWERPGVRVDPGDAAAVLTDMIDAASAILAEELLERQGQDDAQLWARIDASLDDIDARIESMSLTQPAGRGSDP